MRVLVTGSHGFLGPHVCQALRLHGHEIVPSSSLVDVDFHWTILDTQPDAVIHLAKPPSDGIRTMAEHPFTFAAKVLELDQQVITACLAASRRPKLVCLGSVCAYPESVRLPAVEDDLWEGYPEAVNAPYGIAKRTQLMLLQAARQECGLNGIHLVMANVYGPGDRSGHVVPATIRKMRRAVANGDPVVIWGQPYTTRSFLYVADAAEGIVRALEQYDDPLPLNLAPARETHIVELVEQIADLTGFKNWDRFSYDDTQPTGQLRRSYDLRAMEMALGWTPETSLQTGLAETVRWLCQEESL